MRLWSQSGPCEQRLSRNNSVAMQPCVQPMASIVPGRDVVPNAPDLFGGIGVRTNWGGRVARNSESKSGYCSLPRREETIRDAEDSVPPSGVESGGLFVRPRRAKQPCVQPMASTIPGRDVVPNVPDLFGGIGALTIGADVAQGTARVNPVIARSRVAKKRSGTLRTASLPVDGVADCSSARDVRCNRAFN